MSEHEGQREEAAGRSQLATTHWKPGHRLVLDRVPTHPPYRSREGGGEWEERNRESVGVEVRRSERRGHELYSKLRAGSPDRKLLCSK